MTPTYESPCGDIKLFHADCLEVLPTLGSVGALVTDPPYGKKLRNGDVDGHRSERWGEILGDHNQDAGLSALNWAHARRLPVITFAAPELPWPGKWRNYIVWDKGGAVGGGGDIATCLKRSWELIQVARNGVMNGPRCESVWRFPIVPADTTQHIAAKPEELMVALVQRFTGQATVIIDPFMGSGTTGIACIRLGRKFIGIEKEAKYFNIAVKRIEDELARFPLIDMLDSKPTQQLLYE